MVEKRQGMMTASTRVKGGGVAVNKPVGVTYDSSKEILCKAF